MEEGDGEETGSSLIFPLTQKVETKTKRKRSEDVSETRKMRASANLISTFISRSLCDL